MKFSSRALPVLVLLVVALTVGCMPAAASDMVVARSYPSDPANRGKLVVRSYPLNPYNRYLDGQWMGSIVASDGNCYFASSTHSRSIGSAFFKYDPDKRKLTCLSKNIQEISQGMGVPREKIHSDIEEANGWLYFASKEGTAAAGRKGGGGQVLGYNLATRKFRNYGIVHPNHAIYAGIGVDAKRNRLWSITRKGRESQLYWFDLKSGEKKHLGTVVPGGASFYMFVDAKGDCWFTIRGSGGTLYRAAATDGKIERFEKGMPAGIDWWAWGQPLADGNRFVFFAEGKGFRSPSTFWIFDSTKAGSPEAFKRIKDIGFVGLGNALAGKRVYFVQRPGGKKFRSGTSGNKDLRLHSIAFDGKGKPELINHGVIIDQDGRYPWRIHALAADEKGRVYMTGDWNLLPGEKGTDKSTIRVGSGVLNRGQFFSVVDVSGDSDTEGAKQP